MKNKWFILGAILLKTPFCFGLELESYLHTIWENSEQLKGKLEQSELADGDRWRRFTPNEPQFFFISQDNGGWQQGGLTLNMAFPGKSLLMTKPDASRFRATKHDLSATKLDLTKSATDLFLECASAQQQFQLQQKNLTDLQTFSRSLDKLYERGHSTQAETLAIKLQLRQLDSDVKLLETRTNSLCSRLRIFLPNLTATEALEIPEDISESVINELGEESAETLHAKAQIENARAQMDAATWKQLPDISLSAFQNKYFVQGSSPVGRPETYSFQATVTIPIFFLFNELPEARKQIAEARVQRDQAEVTLHLAESSMKQAAAEFASLSKRLIAIKNEDIPIAEAMLESSFSSFRSGRLGFAELMLSRRIYNDLRTQQLQIQVNRLQLRLRCLNRCGMELS